MGKKEVHNAIVTRNTDEDLGVQLRGAIYFNAPTLFDGEFPLPAVPCFPFASDKGAGMFWVPQVGDEIEVEIEADDGTDETVDIDIPEPRYRCMVYSAVADIDDIFKENYTKRMGWKTNSGHYLLFEDTKDKEFLSLVTGKGHQIILSDEKDLEKIFFKTTKGNQLLFDKNENITILTVGNHKILMDDKTKLVEIQHTQGGKLLISETKVELIDNSGDQSVILEAGKITGKATAEILMDAPIAKIGSSPAFHATLAENMIGLHDTHLHIAPQAPVGALPTQPPLVPMSSKAGTPLDPTALSIFLKGNT